MNDDEAKKIQVDINLNINLNVNDSREGEKGGEALQWSDIKRKRKADLGDLWNTHNNRN